MLSQCFDVIILYLFSGVSGITSLVGLRILPRCLRITACVINLCLIWTKDGLPEQVRIITKFPCEMPIIKIANDTLLDVGNFASLRPLIFLVVLQISSIKQNYRS